jgi:hypothetical protein
MQNCIDYITISLFSNEKIRKFVLKLQSFNVFFKLKQKHVHMKFVGFGDLNVCQLTK